MLRLLKNGLRLYSPSCNHIGLVETFAQVNARFKEPFLTLANVETNHLYKLETA